MNQCFREEDLDCILVTLPPYAYPLHPFVTDLLFFFHGNDGQTLLSRPSVIVPGFGSPRGPRTCSAAAAPLRIQVSGCILWAVKSKKKPDTGRAKLEKELREALTEIDEEGLLFLLRQAQVLIYNARVDRINQEAAKLKGGKTQTPREVKEASPSVSIEESDDGRSIFLTLGKARKVLAPEEMRQLVRICYSAETKSEALRQLFTVLARERKDILADALIGNPDNPLLVALFTAVRNTYRLKDS